MTTVVEKIATQIATRKSFSSLALRRAKDAIVDTIGCMLAGANDETPRAVTRAFAGDISENGGSALVGGSRAPASVAALINGTAAHCLDFDDNFHPARAHASAVLVPALLSVATAGEWVTGRQFVHAYLAGLEAQAAVGFGVIPSHYNRGWHGTSTIGAIGAAAGVAVLMGLGNDQIAQAMSLATSSACGPKGQFGTPAKPLHAGLAARNAVEAALLAKAGVAGRLDILERSQGFKDLFGGDAAVGWDKLSFDQDHVIETRGLVTKQHPCCASTHRVIDAARELQDQHGFQAEDIRAIKTKVGISAMDNLAYPHPRDEMQARFSMQYCLATALVHGRLSLGDFTPSAIFRPDIRQMMPLISMSAYTAAEEVGTERLPHQVDIHLNDGRHFKIERLHADGSIQKPLGSAQQQMKFADCLRWAGLNADGDAWQRLMDVEDATSFRSLWADVTQSLSR
jgi:2-methylcitrate dehydratase PrpD